MTLPELEKMFDEKFPFAIHDPRYGGENNMRRKAIKSFLTTTFNEGLKAGLEEERAFILNVLDGVDVADRQMGNTGGGTKAIRFALKSRVI